MKVKQIMAIVGLCLIALMYILTIIFAVSKSPNAPYLLMAAIFVTIAVPVLIYAGGLIARNLMNKGRIVPDEPAEVPEEKAVEAEEADPADK